MIFKPHTNEDAGLITRVAGSFHPGKWWFSAIYHGIAKLAQSFDADDAFVAILQITRGLAGEPYAGWRTCRDDVAGLQSDHAGDIFNQLRDPENQLARI